VTVDPPVAATAVSVISRHTWLSEHPFDATMSAFRSPLVRYGIALPSAAIAVAIGFLVFDGIARYFAFGIAALDLLVLPWILKNATESGV
jgi:hypothetical protein